ncbi:hypothetical protein RRG08_011590 [Elysia crispata]|uniref:Uncharacterized protein n=1 Tax=Elysia crispata TaxID=231223 RepID=A0AAE1CJH5_9GAST|nr:hypothetical protein RRG08_011590 [Elysia crispata]
MEISVLEMSSVLVEAVLHPLDRQVPADRVLQQRVSDPREIPLSKSSVLNCLVDSIPLVQELRVSKSLGGFKRKGLESQVSPHGSVSEKFRRR